MHSVRVLRPNGDLMAKGWEFLRVGFVMRGVFVEQNLTYGLKVHHQSSAAAVFDYYHGKKDLLPFRTQPGTTTTSASSGP